MDMKSRSRTNLFGLVGFAAMLVWTLSSAHATLVRYTYEGNEFDTHLNGFFPTDDRFTGFIDVETDQLPGGSLVNTIIPQGLAIPFFSISDGDRNFNQSNVGGGNFLGFSTDSAGNIDDWFFHLGESVFLFTSKSDSTANLLPIFGDTGFIPFGDRSFINLGNLTASNQSPGTWTRENLQTDPVPEPAALPLFLAGLLGLGFFGSRRKRQPA